MPHLCAALTQQVAIRHGIVSKNASLTASHSTRYADWSATEQSKQFTKASIE